MLRAMAASSDMERDVILRDGTTLRLRPPVATDADSVLAFFQGLTAESVYRRFHGVPRITARLVEPFLDPDWHETGALVGTLAGSEDSGTEPGGPERIVALASYVRLRDATSAEAAFAVADELQGRGIGMRLLEQLAEVAAADGIDTFVAEVLPENRAMLGVFTDAGFQASRHLEDGVVEVRMRIAPTAEYRAHVEQRDHVAVRASLEAFFTPRSVAVLGASSRRGSIGGELFRNILEGDYAGAAYPVNRTGEPVAGVRGYASVRDIPDPVDLTVVCVPGHLVLTQAREALETGCRALVVISAGFAEVGSEGAERQRELLALVRSHGARMIGPNCLGISSSRVRVNATFAPRALPAGPIGFSSQSGALGLALLEAAAARGLGFSGFASIGNKADVSSNDLLEWWEDDPDTNLVLLYLESFGNPRKFAHIARRVARRKPILAMKAGVSAAGQRAASSHTAALASSDAVVETLFAQAGVIRARSLGELVDVAALLSSQPPLRGRRVAVMTNAGGLGILCADACEAAGLELPRLSPATEEALRALLPAEASVANPVDMLGSATETAYEACLPLVAADPGVDAVIVLFVPPVVAGADEVAHGIRRAVDALPAHDKPILASIISAGGNPRVLLEGDRPLATFAYPESAARALGRAAEHATWLRRPAGIVPPLPDVDRAQARSLVESALAGAPADGLWLETGTARALLSTYGIPLVPEREAANPDEAAAAATELRFPVVVKTALAGAHKTESGGVALNLADADEVRAAAARIGGPVVVQPMAHGSAELLAGVLQDRLFGPLVAFGPGGTFAELIGQAQFRLAPLTDADADELVHSGACAKLVAGYRGQPAADADALATMLLRLSALADDFPEISELDLNPVLAGPDGCVVVDWRVRVQRPHESHRMKTW
jgi:acetyl coenzyme A synthetase (ADP forming)-like protein